MTPEEEHSVIMTSTEDVLNVTYDYVDGSETDGMYDFYAVPQIVFVSVLCVFIIVGNSCVLAAIRLSENGRKSRMNFFIMHLALADLLVGVMVCLTDIASKITIEWYAGNVFCKILQYSQAVVTYSSTYMLVSLSIDRYDAVARPMNFSRSGYQGRFLVYTAWLVSFLFALPALFIYTETIEEGKRQCWLDFPALWHWQFFFSAVAVVTFLMPAVIIASCYIAIIYIIWTKGQSHEPHCPADRMVLNQGGVHTTSRLSSGDRRHETGRGIIPQAKIRTIKMTLIIVIVFILCWSPYFLYNLLDIYELLPFNNPMTTLIQSAAPLNSAANPIIYGIFSTRICKNLRRIPMPSCIREIVCHCKESKRCNRLTFRGRNHKFLASQTTDPTVTTYEAHRRSNPYINDIRLSPLKPSDRRCPSLITKQLLDRAIFAETASDLLRRREQEKKQNLFANLTRNQWISDNLCCDFEMAPLTKRDLTRNIGSSGSDETTATSDSNGRFPNLKRVAETNIIAEQSDNTNSVPVLDTKECETILNTFNLRTNIPPSECERTPDFKLDVKTIKKCEIEPEEFIKSVTSSDDQQVSPAVIPEDDHKCERTQKRQDSETVIVPSNSRNIPKLSSRVETRSFEQFSELVLETHLPRDRTVAGGAASRVVGSCETKTAVEMQSGVPEKRFVKRRPSGVPSVRRRLTPDDAAILSNIAGKWRVNEVKADESSVVE